MPILPAPRLIPRSPSQILRRSRIARSVVQEDQRQVSLLREVGRSHAARDLWLRRRVTFWRAEFPVRTTEKDCRYTGCSTSSQKLRGENSRAVRLSSAHTTICFATVDASTISSVAIVASKTSIQPIRMAQTLFVDVYFGFACRTAIGLGCGSYGSAK